MCQHLEEHIFQGTEKCVPKSCLGTNPFNVQDRPMDFNISEYEMVLTGFSITHLH